MKNCIFLFIIFLTAFSCKQTPDPVFIPEPEQEPEAAVEKIEVTIAGFNMEKIQRLISTVPMMTDALVQVVSDYDIVIIQGIPDNRINIVKNINDLTNFNKICDYTYDYIVSNRAGKEQGAVLYNSFELELVNAIVPADSNRRYSTEPFVLFFRIVESGQLFSIFCFESGPGIIMPEAEYLKTDFLRLNLNYDNLDSLLLCDLEGGYTELSGFPENYSAIVFEELLPEYYNTFDCLFLPPKFSENDTAFSGIRYFENIVDYKSLDINREILKDYYLVWMELYF